MSATIQRVILASCLGFGVMALSFLLALYIYSFGAPTLSRVVLWPTTLSEIAIDFFTPPKTNAHPYDHDARGIASFIIGFPAGGLVYAIIAYVVLRKWWKT
jgi:hypothetical protein